MARDRQRAKQRQAQRREERLKARREAARERREGRDGAADGAPEPPADALDADDVGRIAGETGAPPENIGTSDATSESLPPELRDDEEIEELFLDEEDLTPDQEELEEAEADAGFAPRGRRGERPASGEPTRATGLARVIGFLRACWAELQRVQWPDRRQLTQLTGVVLIFIVIMGAYLGVLDAVFSKLIQEII
jgi:preprotein translocase SecE subunit